MSTCTLVLRAADGSTAQLAVPLPIAPDPPSAWPDATNTGVPAGTTLVPFDGTFRSSSDEQVIDALDITGWVSITHDNVTLKRCRITGPSSGSSVPWVVRNGGSNLQVEDCEINGNGNTSNDAAFRAGSATLLRCNIHGSTDGGKVGTGTVVQDCYIHDLNYIQGVTHCDGLQCLDTTSLTIKHNTILAPIGNSAVLLSTGSATDMRNVLIEDNVVGGGNFCIYGGYNAGKDVLSRVSNIQILDNQFSTYLFPQGGKDGPATSIDAPVVFTGNVWFDGPNAGQPVN